MIFKIKTKSISKIEKYNKNSAKIIFCKSNTEFQNFVNEHKIDVNKVRKESFKKDNGAELQIWTNKNPDLYIIKKLKDKKSLNVDFFRDYLAGKIKDLEKSGISSIYINVPKHSYFASLIESELYFYQTFVEGVLLGNYNFDLYKSDKKEPQKLQVFFLSQNSKLFTKAIKDAESVINGVYFSRDLVNEPAITLTPTEYERRVRARFKDKKVAVKVFNKKELAKRKMNAILSVGKASVHSPRLIIAHYKPSGKAKRKIALVGKGVTYDTGGLSIKPTSGMLEMKADMAGSATVFGIVEVAANLNLPIEIIGIVPAVENAISGNAYKPGDVVSTASGKTIEVKDTDAEGRIVLADALEYASKQKPDEIIDFATLTGACVVALGEMAAGVFTKNDKMANNIVKASEETFERAWRLPFWDEYNKLIESKIADVSNLGPRWGGAITAGKFLEHFVDENIPWTHIDLAGPALQHNLTNYTKDYCTGFGVRLITKYLERIN